MSDSKLESALYKKLRASIKGDLEGATDYNELSPEEKKQADTKEQVWLGNSDQLYTKLYKHKHEGGIHLMRTDDFDFFMTSLDQAIQRRGC